jgi:hypothetical protein
MVGGGSTDRGECTVEVFVDDFPQVEIRGATATVRSISGQSAQLRRFECSSPLPSNPSNFKFDGIDGRGRQSLVRDPRNGGVAIFRVEDDDGAKGYTFDLVWDSRGSNSGVYDRGPGYQANAQIYRENDRNRDRYDDQYRGPNYRDSDYYRRYNHGFAVDEAVRVCQQAVADKASRRFRGTDIHFLRTTIVDNNPGRQDWVMGSLDVHRGNHVEQYNFSCSVDFETGRVRTAQIDSIHENNRR